MNGEEEEEIDYGDALAGYSGDDTLVPMQLLLLLRRIQIKELWLWTMEEKNRRRRS